MQVLHTWLWRTCVLVVYDHMHFNMVTSWHGKALLNVDSLLKESVRQKGPEIYSFDGFFVVSHTFIKSKLGHRCACRCPDTLGLGPQQAKHCLQNCTGSWFNIKMPSYQYRKSHCGDKTVVRSSYLHNGIYYTGKMASLYWIRAQVSF